MAIAEEGFELVNQFMSPQWRHKIASDIQAHINRNINGVNGVRNADKKFATINNYLNSDEFANAAKPFLLPKSRRVRVIIFNKSPNTNWLVAWHQDRTVAVSKKFEHQGWTAWTIKDGCHHCQPPLDVLKGVITIRIHLDETTENNGCLKIIPNSHRKGLLSATDIAQAAQSENTLNCVANPGDALIMRPLILHASSKITNNEPRRILHVEFSDFSLPEGIHWA